MKRVRSVGLALGVGASFALASSAPGQNSIIAASGNCPSINYRYSPEQSTTQATGIIHNLGAFTLGVLDQKCRDGEATAIKKDDVVTYRWSRTVGKAVLSAHASTYQMEATAAIDASGVVDPNAITAFSIHEDISKGQKGGTAASVEAENVGTGWRVSVVQPQDGVPYSFTANTGGSMAENEVADVSNLGRGIIEDAL